MRGRVSEGESECVVTHVLSLCGTTGWVSGRQLLVGSNSKETCINSIRFHSIAVHSIPLHSIQLHCMGARHALSYCAL